MPTKKIESNEVDIQKKEKLGGGVEHSVYPYNKFPDKVIKIGEGPIVEEWVKVFNSSPKIFPKIYGIKRIGSSENFYVILEKLDTQKAKDEWQYIEEKMEECNIIDYVEGEYGEDLTDVYLNYGEDKKIITKIADTLKKYDKKAFDLFIKWFGLVKKIERVIKKTLNKETFVDFHKYNFGYDKNGNLKCLDL